MEIRKKEFEKLNELRKQFNSRFYILGENVMASKRVPIPFRIKSIIIDALTKFPEKEPKISAEKFYQLVNEFCEELPYLYGNINNKDPIMYDYRKYGTKGCEIILRENLLTKKLLDKVNETSLKYILDTVKIMFLEAIIEPGEMVGVTSAFLCSEPIMQFTLNTFHLAGVAKKTLANISSGQMINSILTIVKKIKNPTMLIYPYPEDNEFSKMKKIADKIETITMDKLIDSIGIYVERKSNNIEETEIEEDRPFISDFVKYNLTKIPKDLSSIYIRIKLIDDVMYKQNIFIEDVVNVIFDNFRTVYCVHSDNNYKKHIIRIYITSSKLKNEVELNKIMEIRNKINSVVVRGVDGIVGVSVQNKSSMKLRQDYSPEEFKEYYIVTSGTNFHELLKMTDSIDTYKLKSNVTKEVEHELGYEAARRLIYDELVQVYRDSPASDLSEKHLSLVTDLMTHYYTYVPINRIGFTVSPYFGAFQKLSFEIPINQISEAAIFSNTDEANGVEISKFLNKPISGGTGICDIMLDLENMTNKGEISEQELTKMFGF
jgi:DNA-directed RNA polymerase subunit A"